MGRGSCQSRAIGRGDEHSGPDVTLPGLRDMGQTHGLLSRSLRTVSMQSQGCSVLLKSVEVAQWYLAANPNKLAIVLMAEAHTPYVAPLLRDEYHGFRELIRLRKEERLNGDEFEHSGWIPPS